MDIISHKGDITELKVDAIVNAANSELWMGSGVAGAIKRKGGKEIEQEAMAKGPISPGDAVITSGGNLPAKYVIHAAGMAPGGKATREYVQKSVQNSIEIAEQHSLRTIAFPAIGAGVGGLSMTESINTIISAVQLHTEDSPIRKVFLVGYSREAFETIQSILEG